MTLNCEDYGYKSEHGIEHIYLYKTPLASGSKDNPFILSMMLHKALSQYITEIICSVHLKISVGFVLCLI